MKTYIVTFEKMYPGSNEDINNAFVLAGSYREAEDKVLKRYKGEFESAKVINMQLVESDIII